MFSHLTVAQHQVNPIMSIISSILHSPPYRSGSFVQACDWLGLDPVHACGWLGMNRGDGGERVADWLPVDRSSRSSRKRRCCHKQTQWKRLVAPGTRATSRSSLIESCRTLTHLDQDSARVLSAPTRPPALLIGDRLDRTGNLKGGLKGFFSRRPAPSKNHTRPYDHINRF